LLLLELARLLLLELFLLEVDEPDERDLPRLLLLVRSLSPPPSLSDLGALST
jgi:hypothetical protein